MPELNMLKSEQGDAWFQPNGPNTEPLYLGTCLEVDATTEPMGTRDLKFRMNGNREYEPISEKSNPGDKVTGTISIDSEATRNYLERMSGKCVDGTLFLNNSGCGKKGVWPNWQTSVALRKIKLESRAFDGIVKRAENSQFTKNDHSFSAWPPIIKNVNVSMRRVATTEANALNDITFNDDTTCYDCGNLLAVGQVGAIACDAGAGVTANVLFTADNGLTWTAGAADPFAINSHIMSIINVLKDDGTRRYIAGMAAPAGAQGMIAYSDDSGTTWTIVNIGGAAAGHGVSYGGGLFALDYHHIWLASAAGYIYFSSDGGVTWTAQENGAIHAGVNYQIKFTDANYGVCVGAAGIVSLTINGGLNWYAGTIPVAAVLNTVEILDKKHLWVGTAGGALYYSNDFGTTWTQRTGFTGSGVGQVRDLAFKTPLVGYMVKNTAGPVAAILKTIDGGYSWKDIATPTNSGGNRVAMLDFNKAFLVGEANAATGFISILSE